MMIDWCQLRQKQPLHIQTQGTNREGSFKDLPLPEPNDLLDYIKVKLRYRAKLKYIFLGNTCYYKRHQSICKWCAVFICQVKFHTTTLPRDIKLIHVIKLAFDPNICGGRCRCYKHKTGNIMQLALHSQETRIQNNKVLHNGPGNYYKHDIIIDGLTFNSIEHAYLFQGTSLCWMCL